MNKTNKETNVEQNVTTIVNIKNQISYKRIGWIIFLVLTIGLFMFNVVQEISKSGQFDTYDKFDKYSLISNNFFSSSNGETYYVYLYSESSNACQTIEKDIFYYVKSETKTYPMYFYDINTSKGIPITTGENLNCEGATGFNQLTIKEGTVPVLLKISDKEVINQWSGTTSILQALNLTETES